MISRTELEEYARLKQMNIGQAEKDYFQQIVLFILYSHFGKELVFKGGTALSKAYGLGRFSEDLDFTLSREEKVMEIVQQGLKKFYVEAEIEEKKSGFSFSQILRIKGPLYNGVRHSLCKLELDFSLREKVIVEPKIVTLGRLLRELPSFEVVVMAKEEILAEKIRAIMTRTKARDVYDLWFLLQENITIDMDLINEKLQFYNVKYSFTEFKKHLTFKKEIWETELKPLVAEVPRFTLVRRGILEKMKLPTAAELTGMPYRLFFLFFLRSMVPPHFLLIFAFPGNLTLQLLQAGKKFLLVIIKFVEGLLISKIFCV